MRAAALREALLAAGVPCDVDEQERLALLRLRGEFAALADPLFRARVTTLATKHGFTHVAIELPLARDGGQ